ncbi:MAG: hypothetical protein QG628_285 [Patescibacteria group bacterium]|mgnify:CR=1 FL=1|jgi:hypothetical protein|nr:hypothetical protein [Patescibacteria group bacterium]
MKGRPTKLTPEVVSILADCLRQGMTVREACSQAVISHEAYYSRTRSDEHFADIMYKAQQEPTITARQVLIEAINKGDVGVSKWWLERKAADEFGSTPKVEAVKLVKPPNSFADMSDEEINKLGVELSHLMLKS